MILEHALLSVRPGLTEEFHRSFEQARTLIAVIPGFRSFRLSRCLERPDTHLLLVEWDSVEDHTEGFRGSRQYQEWKALLHHFYDPFPVVEHYGTVLTQGPLAGSDSRPAAG